jgi:hypothetical protein
MILQLTDNLLAAATLLCAYSSPHKHTDDSPSLPECTIKNTKTLESSVSYESLGETVQLGMTMIM